MNALVALPDITQVPDYLRGQLTGKVSADALAKGIAPSFPVLSIKGKVWRAIVDGEAAVITNAEGEPRSSINAIIVGVNENISKTYYPGTYVEGSDDPPTCYSNNGVAPADDSPSKQSPLCAGCPHNQWGSRITDQGTKAKACADSRRLALVIGDFDKPFLIRVPATSLRGLGEYGKQLAARQLPVHGVMTKIAFDAEKAYPSLIFTFNGFLAPDQFELATKAMDHLTMDGILYGTQTPSPAGADAATPAAAQPAAQAPAPEPAPAVAQFDAPEPAQQEQATPEPKPRKPRAPKAATPAAEPEVAAAENAAATAPETPAQGQEPTTASPALTKAAEMLGGLLGSFDD